MLFMAVGEALKNIDKITGGELLGRYPEIDRKCLKNPNRADDLERLPPEALAASIAEKERRILQLIGESRPCWNRKLSERV